MSANDPLPLKWPTCPKDDNSGIKRGWDALSRFATHASNAIVELQRQLEHLLRIVGNLSTAHDAKIRRTRTALNAHTKQIRQIIKPVNEPRSQGRIIRVRLGEKGGDPYGVWGISVSKGARIATNCTNYTKWTKFVLFRSFRYFTRRSTGSWVWMDALVQPDRTGVGF